MGKQRLLTALLLGDVCGQAGYRALFIGLPQLAKRLRADIIVVNGENADEGLGITEELALRFFSLGVQVITSGNHIWHREEVKSLLEKERRLLRPANYPSETPGSGYVIIEAAGQKAAIVNLQGRQQMTSIDCPFHVGYSLVNKLRKQTPVIIVDFHAESAQEKEALAYYLDGRVSLVAGTHTHIQTADEAILPNGTAYITDIGMTGPKESVIGSAVDIAIKKQLTQIPLRNEVATSPGYLEGVVCTIDAESGHSVSIQRISERFGV